MMVLLVALVLVGGALVAHRGAMFPIFPTAATLAFITWGWALLDDERGAGLAPWYAACAVAILAGYLAARVQRAQSLPPRLPMGDAEATWRRRTGTVFAAILLLLLVYHFAVGGIPLFNSSVETERFNFSSSGLFGIPGRVYLYGIPFLVLYATMYHRRVGDGHSRRLLLVSWASFALSMLLSGFKGSVLSIAVTYLFTAALSGQPLRLSARNLARYSAAASLCVGFAMAIAFRYSSVGVSDQLEAARYLANRLTTLPAEPGYYALTELGPHPTGADYNSEDLRYFLAKYFGIGDRSELFPLDKRVSAALYGTPLDEERFIVPVTVGGPATLAVDVGLWATVAFMGVFGWIYGFAFVRAQRARTPFAAATWALGAQTMHSFLMKGGLFYHFINFASVLLLLWGLYVAGCVLCAMAVPVLADGSGPSVAAGTPRAPASLIPGASAPAPHAS